MVYLQQGLRQLSLKKEDKQGALGWLSGVKERGQAVSIKAEMKNAAGLLALFILVPRSTDPGQPSAPKPPKEEN